MLIKLESNYEINPERITIEHRENASFAHVDNMCLKITEIELELIRAYHDGKSVNETLKEIKNRMEEAKRKILQKERQKIVDDFFRSFCDICKNGPQTILKCNSCSFSFEWDEHQTFIQTNSLPSNFQPKDKE